MTLHQPDAGGEEEGGTYYGRTAADWELLTEAGLAFLIERARLERDTSYTEVNTILASRTGLRPFDFDLESERAAMGHLLGLVTRRDRRSTDVMISALVLYLNENDAGPGFYSLAIDLGLLTRTARKSEKWDFWVQQVAAVHRHYGRASTRTR